MYIRRKPRGTPMLARAKTIHNCLVYLLAILIMSWVANGGAVKVYKNTVKAFHVEDLGH